jgi:hypothetical protein
MAIISPLLLLLLLNIKLKGLFYFEIYFKTLIRQLFLNHVYKIL